ncbi:MAG: DNA-3-methyladenine glycosylase [Candidatus Staskawiczbacteria bacterium RIFCSPHIGHO2_01_FULL_41_41]|uniref:DNA-3-methyladenine glycosylase n=2 Tax=Parcubacteria group TaxID=1794811 RepID=A0A1G2HST3_9BACT|nr:MAG: DNA-3-methyladenine glycosylase [Candidatus Staskawiczbacteria bacterium RIFCSPHIGHO2_01_FULL_41_41]OGZ75054.1 MAG: DNA-3-methyladenine glycosylase [Candidatus Staskawiczbacteria bacterium RIFCSPLOWO2_01_FULL_43_17b]
MKKEIQRCGWVGSDPLMIKYHDEEWGVPVTDDKKIFEFLVLESAQAGLSWRTILYKREGYRKLFAGFDVKKVAKFTAVDVGRLLKDPAIIRNRLKIEATINNAQRFLEVQKEFGRPVGGRGEPRPKRAGSFSKYMWSFVKGKQVNGKRKKLSDVPAITPEAEAFAKDLKKRGFKFLGATTIYAHMQAVGMVNDHITDCFRYKKL